MLQRPFLVNTGFRLAMPLLLLLLAGCATAQADALPYVDLNRREPLPAAAPREIVPLRVAVAAIISPVGTAESYGDLIRYLGRKLGRPAELVQRRTYAESNQLVETNKVDVGFVCTSAYVAGHDDFGMELLVAPEVNGERVYYSVLIVPAGSPAQNMAGLRGKVFAFTDPMSHSGRVYPTYLLQELGATPDEFFSRTFFTYSHDKAIQAVATGVADGAAVDSMVLDYALAQDPTLHQRVKIIHQSPPFGIPPVVVPPNLSPKLKAQLRQILLDMAADPEGRPILNKLGIDRFVELDDGAYNTARQVIRETGGFR